MFMDWLRKVTDIIMPLENLPEEEVEQTKKVEPQKIESKQAEMQTISEMPMKRVAAGGGASMVAPNYGSQSFISTSNSGTISMDGVRYTAHADSAVRATKPNLKVVKAPDLAVRIYVPRNADSVMSIAEDVLAQRAVIVNYEYINPEEQRKISDFMDGVRFVVDGTITEISEKILMYVPFGVAAGDIAAFTASMRFR